MKTDKHILIVAAAVLAVASCSEKTTASLESLREKAEDHLVKAAGEGDVAIRLMQNQFGAGLSGNLEIGSKTAARAGKIKELEESLRQHLDRVKAIIEIDVE